MSVEHYVLKFEDMAGDLIREAVRLARAGDEDAALLTNDAAEAVLALLDFLAPRLTVPAN